MGREIRTILLVDGSASSLFYLGMLLKELEYKIERTQSADEAFRFLEKAVPSVVLAGMSLQDMNGVNFLKRMKETPGLKDIPIIMMSEPGNPEHDEKCKRLDCAAFLFKPVEPDVLYRTIQSLTELVPRKNIRINTSLKIILGEVKDAARTEIATVLSEGGLFVRTQSPQAAGIQAELRLFLPKREIVARAIVLYNSSTGPDPGMAMKFVDIADADRKAIKAFIIDQLIRETEPQRG